MKVGLFLHSPIAAHPEQDFCNRIADKHTILFILHANNEPHWLFQHSTVKLFHKNLLESPPLLIQTHMYIDQYTPYQVQGYLHMLSHPWASCTRPVPGALQHPTQSAAWWGTAWSPWTSSQRIQEDEEGMGALTPPVASEHYMSYSSWFWLQPHGIREEEITRDYKYHIKRGVPLLLGSLEHNYPL